MDASMASPVTGARTIGIMMTPLPVRVAQAVGLTTSAWLAAQTTAASTLTLPAILLSPAPLLLTQWSTLHRLTTTTTPLLRVLASALFSYLASRQPTPQTPTFKLYLLAAALLPLPIPYALLLTRPTTTELARRATASPAATTAAEAAIATAQKRKTVFPDGFAAHSLPQFVSTHVAPGIAWPFFESDGVSRPRDDELSAHQLVDKWGWLNLGGAAITAAGVLAAGWAAVLAEGASIFELFEMTP